MSKLKTLRTHALLASLTIGSIPHASYASGEYTPLELSISMQLEKEGETINIIDTKYTDPISNKLVQGYFLIEDCSEEQIFKLRGGSSQRLRIINKSNLEKRFPNFHGILSCDPNNYGSYPDTLSIYDNDYEYFLSGFSGGYFRFEYNKSCLSVVRSILFKVDNRIPDFFGSPEDERPIFDVQCIQQREAPPVKEPEASLVAGTFQGAVHTYGLQLSTPKGTDILYLHSYNNKVFTEFSPSDHEKFITTITDDFNITLTGRIPRIEIPEGSVAYGYCPDNSGEHCGQKSWQTSSDNSKKSFIPINDSREHSWRQSVTLDGTTYQELLMNNDLTLNLRNCSTLLNKGFNLPESQNSNPNEWRKKTLRALQIFNTPSDISYSLICKQQAQKTCNIELGTGNSSLGTRFYVDELEELISDKCAGKEQLLINITGDITIENRYGYNFSLPTMNSVSFSSNNSQKNTVLFKEICSRTFNPCRNNEKRTLIDFTKVKTLKVKNINFNFCAVVQNNPSTHKYCMTQQNTTENPQPNENSIESKPSDYFFMWTKLLNSRANEPQQLFFQNVGFASQENTHKFLNQVIKLPSGNFTCVDCTATIKSQEYLLDAVPFELGSGNILFHSTQADSKAEIKSDRNLFRIDGSSQFVASQMSLTGEMLLGQGTQLWFSNSDLKENNQNPLFTWKSGNNRLTFLGNKNTLHIKNHVLDQLPLFQFSPEGKTIVVSYSDIEFKEIKGPINWPVLCSGNGEIRLKENGVIKTVADSCEQ